MNHPLITRFIPAVDRAEAAWTDLDNAHHALSYAEQQWEYMAVRCRRLVRKGSRVTGRPRPDQELGEVALRWSERRDEQMVHVAVMEDGEHVDTIRFPLKWLNSARREWVTLLYWVHQKAIAAELVSNGDTVRAARLRGRRIVHEARLDGKEWRTACGRVVGPVDRDDLGFTDDEVGCGVCSRTRSQ